MRKKIKNIKYFTSSFALMASLWMPKAEAHLNFKMMKDATSFLNPGMEHYSLILGKTALESGLLSNIRLYDLSNPGFDPKTHQRVYSQDTNPSSPVWILLKALFPSTDGSLKAYAGKIVYTPKILGHLINFAYDIRAQKNSDQAINEFLFANGDISKNDRKYFRGILGNIQKAIKEETQNTFLYPQGTTEQIILAFVCEKLNTQKESYEFMDTLRSEIVSPEQHEILRSKLSASLFQEDLLTKDEIVKVSQKTDDTPYTLDDVYALAHAKDFKTNLSPYIEVPGQNISIPAYNRQSKQDSSTLTFSDCLETTLRHVFNSILYVSEEGEFNVKALESLKAQQLNNTFLDSLIEFYQSMSMEEATSDGEKTHILWNHVVGDLNAFNSVDSTKVTYVQHSSNAAHPFEYELDTGAINMVRVFQKILGVTLDPLASEVSLDEKQSWVEASLNHIFTVLNPHQGYQINFNNDDDNPHVEAFNEDIIGILSVVTLDKDREEKAEKLSLNINLLEKHGYVDDIKTIRPPSVQEKEYLDKISDYEKRLETHSTKFESKEASKEIFQNLWLLNLQDFDLKEKFIKERVHHPLYQLFDYKLGDAQANIKLIDHLSDLYPKWKDAKILTEDHKKKIQKITDNIVTTLPLDDLATAKIFMQAFDKIIATEGWEEVFSTDKITKLIIEKNHIEKLRYFRTLEEIKFAPDAYDNIKFEEDMPNLKKLDLLNIKSLPQEGIEGLHHLKNLNELIFGSFELPKLEFKEDMLNITKLDLSKLRSLPNEGIGGLHHLKNLEEIVFGNYGLPRIKLEEDMLNLTKLDLSKLLSFSPNSLENFHHLKNLKDIVFGDYSLFNLKFEEDMLNLTKLDLSNNSIHSSEFGIESWHHLKNLENLSLGGDIKKFKFENDLLSLKKVDLSKVSSFPEEGIEGWHHLKNLEEIIFGSYDFSTFKFDQNILNVKKLDLSKALNFSDKNIKNLSHLKNLENLSLGKDIKKIKFEEDMPNLKVLDLSNVKMMSKISSLEGLHHLKNLEEIVFGTHFPPILKFNDDMLNLKKLDFTNAKISNRVNIEGLHHLKNLEELNFGGNITKLNFEGDMPNLNKLDFSRVKSFPEKGIGGINHLSALKDLCLSDTNDEVYPMIKNMVSLENLSFLRSNIKIIKDLPEGLKTLNIQNCRNIKEIRLSEENKNLILDVKNTRITRHQIKGIEYLSEDNIIGLRD